MFWIYARTENTQNLIWTTESLFTANIIAYNFAYRTNDKVTIDIVDRKTGEVLRTYKK